MSGSSLIFETGPEQAVNQANLFDRFGPVSFFFFLVLMGGGFSLFLVFLMPVQYPTVPYQLASGTPSGTSSAFLDQNHGF